MLVLRTTNFHGATIRSLHALLPLLFINKFSSAHLQPGIFRGRALFKQSVSVE